MTRQRVKRNSSPRLLVAPLLLISKYVVEMAEALTTC
jgi:hypothetical protein